jgi:hypothetical protein
MVGSDATGTTGKTGGDPETHRKPRGTDAAHTTFIARAQLLLVVGFLRRRLELHLELVDEVERELDPQRTGDAPTPRRRSRGQ